MVPGLNRLRPRSVSGPAIVMTVAVVVALCTFIHRKPALLGVEPGSSQQMYWMAGVIAAGVVFLIIMGVYHLLNRHAAVQSFELRRQLAAGDDYRAVTTKKADRRHPAMVKLAAFLRDRYGPFWRRKIRLHCVPVINLFPLEADPLHLSPLENEFLLRPMRIQDGHTEIYSVDNIISSRHTGSQAYVPFSSFRHRGGMLRHDAPERYYHTRVKRGPSGLHDTWLILGGDAFDTDRMLEDETLSLSLTGTNGQLPRKALQSTLLDTPVHASQNVLRVRNLCAPTQPCYPPARDRFHWRVLSHLGSNFLSMMDNAEILRGTLALYDWTESEMNRRRLEAIVDVQHSLIQRFERGFLLRGVDIQVTLDSNGFAGEGDITLFGELLHRFFALYADIHLFTQLTLILQPTGKCLQWTEHHSQRVPG